MHLKLSRKIILRKFLLSREFLWILTPALKSPSWSSEYWASFIPLRWSLANRRIISSRSISTQWIWSKASPSHFQISTVEADVNLRLLSYRTAYRPQWNLLKWNCSGSHCSGVGYHRKCWSSAFFWMFKPYEFKQRLKRVNHMWQDNIQNPNATQYCSTVTVK